MKSRLSVLAATAIALPALTAPAFLAACGADQAGDDGGASSGTGANRADGAADASADATTGDATTGAGDAAGAHDSAGEGSRASDAGPSEGGAQVAWDWSGVVGTGQSLSVGGGPAATVTTTKQPYHNLKLSLGSATVPPFTPTTNPAFSMVPLVEPIRGLATSYPSAYPQNIYGETPHTAMASQISALVAASPGGDYVTAHTVVGENGQAMNVIDKGATPTTNGETSTGRAYAATLFEVAAIKSLADAAGKTYGVGAIVITHGESDWSNPNYEADLVKLWSDYNQDIAAITGQTAKIPMLVSQQHSIAFNAGATTGASPVTLAQWRVGADHPGDIVCSGPKYQYPYAPDNIHLASHGYDLLGEKYGEVYYQKVVLGRDWQPLQPTSVERSGAVVTVHFHVPVPPLAWDTTLPKPHQSALEQWAQGRGFEVSDGATPMTIQSVAISGDAVQITCTAPVPANAVVGYAVTSDGTQRQGGTARWGQLRDSDAVVGALTGSPQPNYAVAFQMTVP